MRTRRPRAIGKLVAPGRQGLLAASVGFYAGSVVIVGGVLLGAALSGSVGASFSVGAVAFDGAAVVLSLLAARSRHLSARARRAWTWFFVAAVIRLAGVGAYLGTSDSHSFPCPGDLLAVLTFPVLLYGLSTLPRQRISRLELRTTLLDGTIVAVGGLLMIWYFVIMPNLGDHGPSAAAIAAAIVLPVGDMVMIFAAVAAFGRTTELAARLPLLLLAVGWVWEFSATPYLGHLRLSAVPGERFPSWLFALWLVAQFCYAAAAFEQCQQRRGRFSPSALRADGFTDALPYVGVAIGLCVLLGSTEDAGTSGVTISIAALTILVLWRQHLVLRENRQRASIDALTGLANRSHLLSELDRSLGQAERTGRRVGVLLADLDEFKSINDRFGHAAGDRALCEFARMLRRAVLGNDVVGRLGGDEFAIVLNDIGAADHVGAVAARIHAETLEPIALEGLPLRLKASIGSAVAAAGERDAEGLVKRADAAMYRIKQSARQPSADSTDRRHVSVL